MENVILHRKINNPKFDLSIVFILGKIITAYNVQASA